METKVLSCSRKILSAAIVAALFVLSPGLGCYEAVAAVIHSQTGSAQAPVTVPGQIGGLTSLPNVSVSLKLSPAGLAAPLATLQQAPSVVATQAPALSAALPVLAAPAAVSQTLAPAAQAAPQAPVTAQQVLQAGADKLAKAPAESEKKTVLDEVYAGAKKSADAAGAVTVPELSGTAALTSGLTAAVPASQKSVAELQAVANDTARPFAERVDAVKAIAAVADEPAKASLKSIGQANPEGNAVDYEVKRKALQSLAQLGEVVSLPAISRAHADEILKTLSADKPQAAIFDYDGTLEANQVKASAETAAALKASADAGVDTMVLTARSDLPGDLKGSTVLESLSTLTPEQKAGLVVGSNRGSRMLVFDKKGGGRLIYAAPVWTSQEREAIGAVAAEVKARYGEAAFKGKVGQMTDYGYSLFLPVGTSAADVEAASEMLRAGLAERGVKADVEGRTALNPRNPSYLVVSKFNKSHGVEMMRKNSDLYGRMRDVVQKLPGKLQGLGTKIVAVLPRSAVPESKTIVVGDHMFGMRSEDLDMAKAAPKGMALAVGGTADPRAERVFVWPTQGHAATQEILGALGRRDSGGVDKKSLFGIFTSRTASIAAFFLTSTAYAFIAIPAVGLASYGALMALGPLAAIAMGPLSGMLAKKLSARNAMALNTVFSVVLLLALPVMSAFGIINFWTLLVASIGNGYVLSSVMTTEGIYIKRFSGKYLGTVNALTMIDYLSIQSLLGLILRAGRLTDYLQATVPHLLAPYLIAAGVNLLVVLPLIWKFVSNAKAADAAAPGQTAKPAKTWAERQDAAKAFLKKYWKEALIFSASLALFPVLHTTLPAVIGLLNWVAHTEGFKTLWANKPLRYALLANSALAVLSYPIQSFGLPLMAGALAGAAGKSQLLGQLLGALFFGQLISSTSQAQLSEIRIPFIGKVKVQRFIQAGVLGLLGTWTFLTLAPGSILLAAVAAAAGAGLMALTGKLTDRGWIKYVGAGLAFLALPLMLWGNIPALFAAVLMMGVFLGPTYNALGTYFYKNIPAGKSEGTIAVRGSIFNGAISMGYAVMSLLTSGLHMAFPVLLWPLVAAALVLGLGFLFLPKLLPGLPDKSLKDKQADR
ncbi:MAG: hypothetical protein NTY77_09100 [Elusimicrobia bacterium]|nr:hypothetical protein [Elusimicrobiota bacterium]